MTAVQEGEKILGPNETQDPGSNIPETQRVGETPNILIMHSAVCFCQLEFSCWHLLVCALPKALARPPHPRRRKKRPSGP